MAIVRYEPRSTWTRSSASAMEEGWTSFAADRGAGGAADERLYPPDGDD